MKDALEAETEKTAQMQEAMKKVDVEMKRSDELLSQMIPKAVAEKVKKGLNPVDTCEVFFISDIRIVFNKINYQISFITQMKLNNSRFLNKSQSYSMIYQPFWIFARNATG